MVEVKKIPCYICGELVATNIAIPVVAICGRCHELEKTLREAMPYYDSDYYGEWDMTKLLKRIREICNG